MDQDIFIDPEIARLLEAAPPLPARSDMPIAEARAEMEERSRFWNRQIPDLPRVEELSIDGPGGPLRARLMVPEAAAEVPLVVYFHGGGWTLGSIDSHHGMMRRLAKEAGAAVLGVDYRLAPEAPFPGPLDDCLATIEYARGVDTEGVDPSRLVLGGDSAGANLALGALLTLRDRGDLDDIKGGALFYGCYADMNDTASHRAFGDGRFRLGTAEMDWFWGNYLGEQGRGHAYAEPLNADLHGLPSLFLNCGSIDPLLDDSLALVARLREAGVEHDYREYPGLVHGFLQMTLDVAAARAALAEAGAAIRAMLAD
jgi:acetyl esterase